ncbi:hypothetical protein D3C85_1390660 [compost metagenome]
MPLALASLAMPKVNALPPRSIFQPSKEVCFASSQLRIICRIVGTQWEKVTFSSRNNRTRLLGS